MRMGRSKVLDSPQRKQILEEIKARPGICLSEIIKACGLHRGTVRYHLDQLERVKLIMIVAGKKNAFFPYSSPRHPSG